MPPKGTVGSTTNSAADATKRNITTAMDAAAARAPPAIGKVITLSIPYVIILLDLVDKSGPYLQKAYAFLLAAWVFIQPYHPEQLAPIACGLILCCFGGSYVTLIAAVEAFRMVGYERMMTALTTIYTSIVKAMEASRKDDAIDDNKDGVADVLQISQQQLLTRKMGIVFKAVDPDRFSEAVAAIWSGSLAVIATLRVQFAQAITLGTSLGNMGYAKLGPVAEPVVANILPPDAQKWAPTLVSYACKTLGVSVAWFLQRVISAFYSASRGGQMFATNLEIYLRVNRGINLSPAVVHAIGLGLAGLGFLWQLNHGFSVPFPLNILLLPVTVLEYVIMVIVGVA